MTNNQILELIEIFDQTARTWGWEQDMGTGSAVDRAETAYDVAKKALIDALKDDGSTRLYFEAHITVTPIEGHFTFDRLVKWAEQRDLRASKFEVDFVDEAHGAWFLSAKAENKAFLLGSVIDAVKELKRLGYNVTRWKIEETVWDSKYNDTFESALQDIRA